MQTKRKGQHREDTGPIVHPCPEPTGSQNGSQQKNSRNGSDPQPSVKAFCAVHRPIGPRTVRELLRRDLLHLDGDRWRFGDNSNHGVTRSLSDLSWKHSHTKGNTWHRLIGLADVSRTDRSEAWLVIEGSKDALAAAEIAQRIGVLRTVGILAALGSGYRPIPAELKKLRGRKVRVIGDNDAAGRETMLLVSNALTIAGVEHSVWNWESDGSKDLYEWLTGYDSPSGVNGEFSALVYSKFFSPCPPSYRSTVQPFNYSTTNALEGSTTNCQGSTTNCPDLSEQEAQGIVAPFIVTQRGTGNKQSFMLARAIKPRDFDVDVINQIFRLWFARSRPLLKPDAKEDQWLTHFFRQLTRVRFTATGLEAACERARNAPLPEIPTLAHNQRARRLAALCRELQRDAGTHAFICPVNVVQQFLDFGHPSPANYVLHVLEQHKVIECVERGAPNKPGVKGKPTFWRYKLPL